MPFKVFQVNEILTAADVNDFLAEQVVATFAGTAARGSAIGTPVTGQVTYLEDSGSLEVYGGTASGWVSARDSALGSAVAGDTLTYDGTNWVNGPKSGNAIINGDFGIWQRGTSTTSSVNFYGADRWIIATGANPNDFTMSRQAFTPGDIEAVGYGDAEFYCRVILNTYVAGAPFFEQRVEDVRTLAGQTAVISFWAKASSAANVNTSLWQVFGSGGSAALQAFSVTTSLTTDWQRFSYIVDIPSVAGKTIGAGSNLRFRPFTWVDDTLEGVSIDIWGVQLEAGPVATPFRLAGGGSKAAELALCQRYYYRLFPDSIGDRLGFGFSTTTEAILMISFPTTMRTAPTSLEQSGTASDYSLARSGLNVICDSVPTFNTSSVDHAGFLFSASSGLFAGEGVLGRAATTNAFLAWSAEL